MKIGWILVALQLISILLLLHETSFLSRFPLNLIQFVCVGLVLWAYLQFEPSQFSIFPRLKKDAHLIKSGPYAFVRNPMYSALIIYFACNLVEYFSFSAVIYFVLLVAVLMVKIQMEEKELRELFLTESTYFDSTKRLFPFLY